MRKKQIIYHFCILFLIGIIAWLSGCVASIPTKEILADFRNPCNDWVIDTSQTYVWDEVSYRMEFSGGKLSVVNDIGSIYIGSSPDEKLYIRSQKFATSEENLKNIQLTADPVETGIDVNIHYWNTSDSLVGYNQLEVFAPPHLNQLEIKSQAATIKIDGYYGGLSIYNSCGECFIEHPQGNLDIQGQHGDIYINHQKGGIRASSTTGDIICTTTIESGNEYDLYSQAGSIFFTPLDAIGEISIRTSTGNIDMGSKVTIKEDTHLGFNRTEMQRNEDGSFVHLSDEFEKQTNIGFTGNDIEGKLGSGDARIELETINGNIYIK